MKEITLENLLSSEEHVSEYTADMDEVLRQTSNTADTLNRVAELLEPSDDDRDGTIERLKEIEAWFTAGNLNGLRLACRDYFTALAWLVKNTTICEQVAAKFHDTLKFNVERAAAKMLQEIQAYDN